MLFSRHFAAAFIGSVVFSGFAGAQDKEPEAKPIPRESLRYDGKPFEYWRTYWQTELKAERRVECLRAMGDFGSNGYGKEAATAIVEVIRSYPEIGVNPWHFEPEKHSPDEKVYYESFKALIKIGSPSVEALFARADDPNVRGLIQWLLSNSGIPVPPNAVPSLVQMAISDKKKERDLALDVIYYQVYRDEKFVEPVLKMLTKPGIQQRFYSAVLLDMRLGSIYEPHMTEDFLCSVAPYSPTLPSILITELRELKKARQKDVEETKSKASKIKEESPDQSFVAWEYTLSRYRSRPRSASVVIAKVLGKMGPAARAALPELRDAAQDPYVELQNAAKAAIEQITKKQP